MVEVDIIDILQRFGVPTLIVLWYLFIEKPNQEKKIERIRREYEDKIVKEITSGFREVLESINRLSNYIRKILEVRLGGK